MSIVTDQNCYDFVGVESKGTFTITAANDKLIFTSDQGGPVTIDIPDDTYEGAGLATALQTAMNANSTLTGGAITFAVSYSSTTYFFTVDATTGYTIALTYSGSDAALTLGFSEDKAAAQTIASDTTVPADPADIVTTLHAGVEQKVIRHHFVDSWDSASYTHEIHSGTGYDKLNLKNRPITAVAGAFVGRLDAINIKNTDGAASNASVTITTSTMTLTLTGGANPGDNSVAFSSYATLSAVVGEINTFGEGWSAAMVSSDYDDMASTELLPVAGKYVGARGSVTPGWTPLEIVGDPASGFEVDGDDALYRPGGWPCGTNNIAVSYTAGYSSATMPGDLKEAVLRWVKIAYDRIEESGDGMKSMTVGQITTTYLAEIPDTVRLVLDDPKYKRCVII